MNKNYQGKVDPMFVMSMYGNKSDLYRAKATYYMDDCLKWREVAKARNDALINMNDGMEFAGIMRAYNRMETENIELRSEKRKTEQLESDMKLIMRYLALTCLDCRDDPVHVERSRAMWWRLPTNIKDLINAEIMFLEEDEDESE